MKKLLVLTLALIMLMSLFGCSGEDAPPLADNDPSSQQAENGRSKATEFTFELAAEEERIVENLVFDEDVTVSGDFGIIVFENCEFNGDVICTAEQFTRVILSGTTVNGNCVFKNTIKEASMDYPMPK
ncbi:MAG: pentapeptide repeat-containing protein, partial [Firmicutes bacterium]|nr:pentapeptide repeat-containing protein [Bacillota bacterium]